jgi:hypothetical protein
MQFIIDLLLSIINKNNNNNNNIKLYIPNTFLKYLFFLLFSIF